MREKKTKVEVKQVLIEDFYSEEKNGVYWNYRFNQGEWQKLLTPYKELPFVQVMGIKKSDVKGNHKVNIDLRKLKRSFPL